MEVSGQRHSPSPLYSLVKKRRAYWIGGWVVSKPVWTQRLKEKLFTAAFKISYVYDFTKKQS
jgi:hypothetical protein